MMPDLPTEEADMDDDIGKYLQSCRVAESRIDREAHAEAIIEERVAEIQNLLQEGATWQAVDIWLSEGDPLVSLSPTDSLVNADRLTSRHLCRLGTISRA